MLLCCRAAVGAAALMHSRRDSSWQPPSAPHAAPTHLPAHNPPAGVVPTTIDHALRLSQSGYRCAVVDGGSRAGGQLRDRAASGRRSRPAPTACQPLPQPSPPPPPPPTHPGQPLQLPDPRPVQGQGRRGQGGGAWVPAGGRAVLLEGLGGAAVVPAVLGGWFEQRGAGAAPPDAPWRRPAAGRRSGPGGTSKFAHPPFFMPAPAGRPSRRPPTCCPSWTGPPRWTRSSRRWRTCGARARPRSAAPASGACRGPRAQAGAGAGVGHGSCHGSRHHLQGAEPAAAGR